ncbi:MAG: ankyrin repeat domain-containing protein [Nocardioidaceae bacterium]
MGPRSGRAAARRTALVSAAALLAAACSDAGPPARTSAPASEASSAAATEPERDGADLDGADADGATIDGASVDQATLDRRLRAAAWADDVPRARRLVRRGGDVNAKDDTEQSAYLIATSEGHLELLRLALRSGARVNDKDGWNGTGLIRAAERGHWLVVGELLRAGIDRDHVNRIGYQAVHESIWLGEETPGYAATVRVLAAGGVELDRASGSEGLTPLAMAQERGNGTAVRTLARILGRPAPADADAALLRAAATGDADGVAAALRAGADIETRDPRRRTPLLLAVTGDHVAAAQVLVALGASPDALDAQHDTPWLVTGVTGSVAMLQTLLPAHPDLTIRNRYGGLSVIPASERGHVAYVRRVVRTGIDVDHVNDLGWTALLEAVILGDGGPRHTRVVRILLRAGADPTIADGDGVTPRRHAELRGFTSMAEILARAGG